MFLSAIRNDGAVEIFGGSHFTEEQMVDMGDYLMAHEYLQIVHYPTIDAVYAALPKLYTLSSSPIASKASSSSAE